MNVRILPIFLLLSSSLLFSTVRSDPNHHHDHNNNFPWQNILSAIGIVIENQTNAISNTEVYEDASIFIKEYRTTESTVEMLNSEATVENETPEIGQNGTRFLITSTSNNNGLGLGYKIGIPIASIAIFVCFWYFLCKCCCACCRDDTPNVVVMQQPANIQPQQPPPAPQIILQQPIIHQQAPPVYEVSQRWAHPPPQWGPPPQGPPQWAPQPMGQQQHYSPTSGYDNHAFNPATAPPAYNTGKY